MAFHASQGAEFGLPQMIQSRAQFGFRGVVVVLIGTLFTFLGFNVADSVLIRSRAQRNSGLERAGGDDGGVGSPPALLAIYGHDWLHRIFRWCFCALSAALRAADRGDHPGEGAADACHGRRIFVRWRSPASSRPARAYNITYAPSVSDYSRYLPRNTRRSSIIAAVYLGRLPPRSG